MKYICIVHLAVYFQTVHNLLNLTHKSQLNSRVHRFPLEKKKKYSTQFSRCSICQKLKSHLKPTFSIFSFYWLRSTLLTTEITDRPAHGLPFELTVEGILSQLICNSTKKNIKRSWKFTYKIWPSFLLKRKKMEWNFLLFLSFFSQGTLHSSSRR